MKMVPDVLAAHVHRLLGPLVLQYCSSRVNVTCHRPGSPIRQIAWTGGQPCDRLAGGAATCSKQLQPSSNYLVSRGEYCGLPHNHRVLHPSSSLEKSPRSGTG